MNELQSIKNYLHIMLCHYVDGDFKKAEFFLELLENEKNKNPSIIDHLDKYDLYRYKLLKKSVNQQIYTNRLSPIFRYSDSYAVNNEIQNDVVELSERLLVKKIIRNHKLLQKVIKSDLKLACTELDTGNGFCDLVGYTKKIAIPFEIKLELADHKVVGQIIKYMKYFIKRLNYGFYRDVLGVIIAKKYTDEVLQELKKINVLPLTYISTPNSFTIQRVLL